MPVQYSLNKIDNGFTITVKSTENEVDTLIISSYELSRNNIRADKVRSIKFNNFLFGDTSVQAESDSAFFPRMRGGVQPLVIGRGDLKITSLFSNIYHSTFIFYYDATGSYMTSLYQAAP